ncbi:MAG: PE-PPE domain-containing protein [Mycobacterium sp.]
MSLGRSFGIASAVLIAAVPAIVGPGSQVSTQSATTLDYQLAGTALIMGGTGVPLSIPPDTEDLIGSQVNATYSDLIEPSGLCVGGYSGCRLAAAYTPEQLSPLIGTLSFGQSVAAGRQLIDNCLRGAACITTEFPFTSTGPTVMTDSTYVVVGESQSSVISSYEKSYLIAHPVADETVSFILISNQNRPNGGVLERFVGSYIPIVDIVFNGATPTGSPEPTPLITVDIASQYDGWADFPTNPLNLLADLNGVLGAALLHNLFRTYLGEPQLQGQFQDTTYYLQTPSTIPLLLPLTLIPLIGQPLADVLDPFMRVLVETAYDRTINPGQPTPANYLYFPDPIKTLVNLAIAIPTGWDDVIADVSGDPSNRPFGTLPEPPYGIGGAPVYAGAIDPYGDPVPLMTNEESPAASSAALPASASATTTSSNAAAPSRRGPRGSSDSKPATARAQSKPAGARTANTSHRQLRKLSTVS